MDFGKTQIGNMTFVKCKKGGLPFIKVSTVSGDFSVEYGAGSVMFMMLNNTPLEDKVDNLPMLIVRNAQYVANCIDVELQVDVLKAICHIQKEFPCNRKLTHATYGVLRLRPALSSHLQRTGTLQAEYHT